VTAIRVWIALLIVFAACHVARAEDVCPMLSKLLDNPPAGFVASRAAPSGAKHWISQPLLAHPAQCLLWQSARAEAHEIRCTVDDRAPPAETAAFFDDTAAAIDRCLAARSDGRAWHREAAPVAVPNGLSGRRVFWVFDNDAIRFRVGLADFRRHHDGSSYDELSVEYLKY
jgi:hypothetical protein